MVTTNKEKKTSKKMSIQVSLNGLSFCILDKETNKICYLSKLNFEKQLDPVKVLSKIEEAYDKETELNQDIEEVAVVFNNPLFSLVPQELFDEENAAGYLKFNTRILKTDFIAFDNLRNETVNVYIPYANIINYFFDRYGEFEYRHSMSVLIESLLTLPKKTSGPVAYLHVHHKYYELVIIENGKLIFANSFEYDTKEDFLYYLLFTAEQLNLDPEKFDLIFLGSINKESEEYKLTWNYIKNVSFLGPFHTFEFQPNAKPSEELAEYLLIKSL